MNATKVAVTIDRLGERGEGVAQTPGSLVFVPYALPGEAVLAEIEGSRDRLATIITPSPNRIAPHCPYFARCGGCAVQTLAEPFYAQWKRDRVAAAARRSVWGTLLSRLTGGIGWKVFCVNTHRPLFWFLGGPTVRSMTDLRGRRLAVHAAHTAPGCFAWIVLRKHGLDPDRDLKCVARAPGDCQMDLRRLRNGSVDAAYAGSTLSPEQIAAEEGFSVLSWAGDHFQIPTVGIAVDPARIPLDDPALQALTRANRRALVTIAEQPRLAVGYIANFLDRLTSEEAQQYYDRYIGPFFTPDGRVDLAVAQHAIDTLAAELGVASLAADEIYQPSL